MRKMMWALLIPLGRVDGDTWPHRCNPACFEGSEQNTKGPLRLEQAERSIFWCLWRVAKWPSQSGVSPARAEAVCCFWPVGGKSTRPCDVAKLRAERLVAVTTEEASGGGGGGGGDAW